MPLLKSRLFSISMIALCTSGMPILSAHAAIALVPHRAVYDVKLKEASDRSGIDGMDGRIVYEFRGSKCDGYTTTFRFVTRLNARGEVNLTDQRTSTYEDAAGESFRFITKTYVNENQDKEIEGTARIADDGIAVALKSPDKVNLEFGSALFPTKHTIDMLERAQAGEKIYEEFIFDGSDGGDRVLSTTVVIGPQKEEPVANEAAKPLEDDPYRNISIAYFDQQDEQAEGLPEYSIAFKMHDNGITRGLEMDYGDFVLSGEMSDLEIFEAETCE